MINKEIDVTDLCEDLCNFVSEHDKNGTKNTLLQGIEHYFNPDDNKFLACTTVCQSICNEVDFDGGDFGMYIFSFCMKSMKISIFYKFNLNIYL